MSFCSTWRGRRFSLGLRNDVDTILYRQESPEGLLEESGGGPGTLRSRGETIERTKKHWLGHVQPTIRRRCCTAPSDLLEMLCATLRKLRGIAEAHAGRFESEGFTTLFAMLRRNWATSTWPAFRII